MRLNIFQTAKNMLYNKLPDELLDLIDEFIGTKKYYEKMYECIYDKIYEEAFSHKAISDYILHNIPVTEKPLSYMVGLNRKYGIIFNKDVSHRYYVVYFCKEENKWHKYKFNEKTLQYDVLKIQPCHGDWFDSEYEFIDLD